MIDWLHNYGSLTLLVTILGLMHFLGMRCVRGQSQRASQPADTQSQIGAAAHRSIGKDDPAPAEGEPPPHDSYR